MFSRVFPAVGLVCLLCQLPDLRGQNKASTPSSSKSSGQQPSISVQVNEVIVPVTVTDEKGRFVSDLDQKDFRIFDEGKEQRIEFFTRERSQPVVVGFLMDLSNASRLHWKNYQDAAIELVLNLLPGDKKYSGYLIGLWQRSRAAGEYYRAIRADRREASETEAGRRLRAVRRHLYGVHQPQTGAGRAHRAAPGSGGDRRRARQRKQADAERSARSCATESGHDLRRQHGGFRLQQRRREKSDPAG